MMMAMTNDVKIMTMIFDDDDHMIMMTMLDDALVLYYDDV